MNRENGSAFDNFINMGAIEPLSPEETKYLINQTEPEIKKEKLPSLNTQYNFTAFWNTAYRNFIFNLDY